MDGTEGNLGSVPFGALSVIELGQSAFAGFPEAVVQVDACLLHGPADHIVAYVSGAGEEVAQVAGVHGPDGGDGVAFDAGDLHQAADGVAGETQVMLHGDLCGILHLVQILLVQLGQGGGGHRAGGADLGLAAAFCAGNGGVGLGQVADDAGGGKSAADLFVAEALGDLGIFQHGGKDAAGTAGGGGDHGAVVRVLLGNGVGIGGDPLEFDEGRLVDLGVLLIEVLCLPVDIQTAGQDTFSGKTFVNGVLHCLPDLHQEVPYFRTFVQFHVFGQGIDVAPLTEIGDLRKGVLDIDFLGVGGGPFTGDPDVTAADGFYPQVADLDIFVKGGKIHGVGVHPFPAFLGEEDLGPVGAQRIQQHPVGAVADTGLTERTIQGHTERSGIGIAAAEQQSSPLGSHGMGRRGPLADFIDLADGFHGKTSVFCIFKKSIAEIMR